MTSRLVGLSLALSLAAGASPARAQTWLIPPVDGPIAVRFDAPDTRWGPGHRGIDYLVPAGTSVRAAGDGTVSFAGSVVGTIAVTIDHGQGLETTYTDLASVTVSAGQRIRQGHVVGVAGVAHDSGAPGLHLGVIVDGSYVDPELHIGPLDISAAIHLAPHVWMPPDTLPTAFRTPFLTSAEAIEPCEDRHPIATAPVAPNDNIAVLIAGIGSRTERSTTAALYEGGEDLLGYAARNTYRFSYRSTADDDFHVDYARSDTFGDLNRAGERLRTLLERVAHRHPGRAVDLIAHSQGGIVARTYLQLAAQAWDPALPRVEHLVTFATPHGGAPVATGPEELGDSVVGRALLEAGSWLARRGGPLPDPQSPAVAQLAPGSDLMEQLSDEGVLYGTRVLTLGIPNDVVVPADRALWPGHRGAIVEPSGLNGHDAIVTSEIARGIAHRFLRDARPACRDGWDLWGPRIGAGIGLIERAALRLVP